MDTITPPVIDDANWAIRDAIANGINGTEEGILPWPFEILHTVIIVLNGRHGGVDVILRGTDAELEEIEHILVVL